MHVPPEVTGPLKSLTLIIYYNSSPVVAKFTFGLAAGTGGVDRSLSTRVRIDTFSYVRAILETGDGTLAYGHEIRASLWRLRRHERQGPDTENADLGKMLVKTFPPALSTTPLF